MAKSVLLVLSELVEVGFGILVGILANDERYKFFLVHAIIILKYNITHSVFTFFSRLSNSSIGPGALGFFY